MANITTCPDVPGIHKLVTFGVEMLATGSGEEFAVNEPIDGHPPEVAVTTYVPGDEIEIDEFVPPVFHK